MIRQPGQVLFNGYRVSSVIGQGGMGIVHLVEHPDSSRTFRFAMMVESFENQFDFARAESWLFSSKTRLARPRPARNLIPFLNCSMMRSVGACHRRRSTSATWLWI